LKVLRFPGIFRKLETLKSKFPGQNWKIKFSKIFHGWTREIFFPGSDMQKNVTDRVDFPMLKIPEWYFLQCTPSHSRRDLHNRSAPSHFRRDLLILQIYPLPAGEIANRISRKIFEKYNKKRGENGTKRTKEGKY
jgi:hypothetical protein